MNTRSLKAGRVLFWTLLVIMLLATVGYFSVGALAANALTMPKRDFAADVTPAQVGLVYENVRFAARDGAADIAGWFIPGEGIAPAIIDGARPRRQPNGGCGEGSFLQEAKLLHDAGYSVLMIDLRGHGQSSDARFTFGLKERSDVLGAVDLALAARRRTGADRCARPVIRRSGEHWRCCRKIWAIGALVTDSGFADINVLIEQQWEGASGLPKPFLYAALLMARLMTGVDLTQSQPVALNWAEIAPAARAADPLRGRRLHPRGQPPQPARCVPRGRNVGDSGIELPALRRLQRRPCDVWRNDSGFLFSCFAT